MIAEATRIIQECSAIFIGAGAGIGVDSGLPDFRSNNGFWKHYPLYERLGLNFYKLANPQLFIDDPRLAWGFYYHRSILYKKTNPHYGFDILKKWTEKTNHDYFIYTSNVDQQFQKAGFDQDKLIEIHGNIYRLQCSKNCNENNFRFTTNVDLDYSTMRLMGDLPFCSRCGTIVRPNVLMFGDKYFNRDHVISQYSRYNKWLKSLKDKKIAILEIGAGSQIPSVRIECETLSKSIDIPNIRINLNECGTDSHTICLKMKSIEALTELDKLIGE